MKKYQEYMDSVTVSDTLHEKLTKLEAKPKQSRPWKQYGIVAAALALVIGVGGWGLGRMNSTELGGEVQIPAPEHAVNEPAIGVVDEPAVEPSPVPMPNPPGMEMMGGYEVRYGEGEHSTVAYYYLPAIFYGEVEQEMVVDVALPVGVYRRDLTPEEIEALFGGAHNLAAHLNWSDYTIYAHAMLNRDGSLWMLCISGSKGDTGLEHFMLEVSPDQLPPSCLYYAESRLNDIWGREVRAESYDSLEGSSRRVSFMDEGYGYRFEITGFKAGEITELVSRLVRWIIVGDGLLLNQNQDVPADVPAANEEATTMPYDPSAIPTPVPTVEPAPPEP